MEAESGSETDGTVEHIVFYFDTLGCTVFEGQPRGLLLPGSNFRSYP